MAYHGLDNKLLSKAELALLADENGRDVLLVLVKSSYDIADDGSLIFSEEQESICFEGEYFGEPGLSSLKIAPEANFEKLTTDVVLIGHAHAPNEKPVIQFDVGLQVGDMRQHIRVFGDRVWQRQIVKNNESEENGNKVKKITWVMSEPQPIVKVPLIYEKAFGGQDLTPEDEKLHVCEPRNLLGTGVIAKHSQMLEVALPNLEDPKNLIRTPEDRPEPLSMCFVGPDCQPRLSFSGTYDEDWKKTRLPMLPSDFKREFFNAAHPKLIAKEFLKGNEIIHIVNACPQGRLSIKMPGDRPAISIKYQYDTPKKLKVELDTILINTDDMKLTLLWRANEDIFNKTLAMEKVMVEEELTMEQAIPDSYELMA